MCGIIGYIGQQQAIPFLLEGLRRLEYRGYDSSGVAVKNGNISVHKKTGKVADLEAVLPTKVEGTCGIAHTRWATHGGVTDDNAHPHCSQMERLPWSTMGLLKMLAVFVIISKRRSQFVRKRILKSWCGLIEKFRTVQNHDCRSPHTQTRSGNLGYLRCF